MSMSITPNGPGPGSGPGPGPGSSPSSASPVEEITLKLGDVVILRAPSNPVLNNHVFLIEYLDPTRAVLVESDTFRQITLPIHANGIIGDGDIASITVLSSNPLEGYARQNDLLPGKWVDIHFRGEQVPIRGEIIGLEEDQIEVRTVDGDVIYLNFQYQGIPRELPITSLQVTAPTGPPPSPEPEPPAQAPESDRAPDADRGPMDVEEALALSPPPPVPMDVEEAPPSRSTLIAPSALSAVPAALRPHPGVITLNSSDLAFGDILVVEETVAATARESRFSADAQASDLMEEILAKVPDDQRSDQVLANIHRMVRRFMELRRLSSTFDANDNVSGPIRPSADARPLAEHLAAMKNRLYWVAPVARNVKKLYVADVFETEELGENDGSNIDGAKLLNNGELLRELEKEQHEYWANTNRHAPNKYAAMCGAMGAALTPFFPPARNARDPSVLVEADVAGDMRAVMDNVGDLQSTVVAESKIATRRFLMQQYNLGLNRLQSTNLKGSKFVAHRVKLTPNDSMAVTAVMTFPEPTIQFSKITCPTTNVMDQASLSQHFLDYWRLLQRRTRVTPVILDELESEVEFSPDNVANDVKHFSLSPTVDLDAAMPRAEVYRRFLQAIVPSTGVLAQLMQARVTGQLSFLQLVRQLEPFMVLPIDVTREQFVSMDRFMREQIKDRNLQFHNDGLKLAEIYRAGGMVSPDAAPVYRSPLFAMLDGASMKSHAQVIADAYGIDLAAPAISGSEFLKRVTEADGGRLLHGAMALSNVALMFPQDLNSVLEREAALAADGDRGGDRGGKGEGESEGAKCRRYVIAKKYYSMHDLRQDNGRVAYYDKAYDKTDYDALEKFARERDTMTAPEFHAYLAREFERKGMSAKKARQHATTLQAQARRVQEGEFAVLVSTSDDGPGGAEGIQYYVRKNSEWVADTTLDPSHFITDEQALCDLQYDCAFAGDDCRSTASVRRDAVRAAIKHIVDQFSGQYARSEKEMQEEISRELARSEQIFGRLMDVRRRDAFRFNDMRYQLGLRREVTDRPPVSPHAPLLDLILAQSDFVKQQRDLISFVHKFATRGDEGVLDKDEVPRSPNWMYCNESGLRLMPAFRFQLATAYFEQTYLDVLATILRDSGEKSADGAFYVDRHSGQVICPLEFDASEGYTEDGFVDRSRSVLAAEPGLSASAIATTPVLLEASYEGRLIAHLVTMLASNMGLPPEPLLDAVVQPVKDRLGDTSVLMSRAQYTEILKRRKKDTKAPPPYEDVFHAMLVNLTLGMFLIAVQTNIPALTATRTILGCRKTFRGYPMFDRAEDGGLVYVVCAAQKMHDMLAAFISSEMEAATRRPPPQAEPAQQQQQQQQQQPAPPTKVKLNLSAKNVRSVIDRFLWEYPEVQKRVMDKVQHMVLHPGDDLSVPEERVLGAWASFLPPLRKFHVPQLENIGESFRRDLWRDLDDGSPRQQTAMLVVESKIIMFAMAVQELIQRQVEKKELMTRLGGTAHMTRAGSDDQNAPMPTPLQYFEREDHTITRYNDVIVPGLSAIVRDVRRLTQSVLMMSSVDTQRAFPALSTQFSTETIYQGFITLCKFHLPTTLNEELAAVCPAKPANLVPNDSLFEQIDKIRSDGHEYSEDQFRRLIQVVARNNLVRLTWESAPRSSTDAMQRTLLDADGSGDRDPLARGRDDGGVNATFAELLARAIPGATPRQSSAQAVRELNNYLAEAIGPQAMKKTILDFIHHNAGYTKRDTYRRAASTMDALGSWSALPSAGRPGERGRAAAGTAAVGSTPGYADISDNATSGYVQFMANFTALVSAVFPSMIATATKHSIDVPKYWKLNPHHAAAVEKMVSSSLQPLEAFYGKRELTPMLDSVARRTRHLRRLAAETPFHVPIRSPSGAAIELPSRAFDDRTSVMLQQYYFLSTMVAHIRACSDPAVLRQVGAADQARRRESGANYEAELLRAQREREMGATADRQSEAERSGASALRRQTARLLTVYLHLMRVQKKTMNVSPADIEDVVFKLKEAEKHTFTDRLQNLSDEERALDGAMRKMHLGIYGIGQANRLRSYDQDIYAHDKEVAEKVAEIQRRRGGPSTTDEADAMDALLESAGAGEGEDEREAMRMNPDTDYNDGDPWGDEEADEGDYE